MDICGRSFVTPKCGNISKKCRYLFVKRKFAVSTADVGGSCFSGEYKGKIRPN